MIAKRHKSIVLTLSGSLFFLFFFLALSTGAALPFASPVHAAAGKQEILPSWNEGTVKEDIMRYVEEVTNPESNNFIEIHDRIATFDNDGNLWSEQPLYFQLLFAIDRIKALESMHPEWKNKQPFQAALNNDIDTLLQYKKKELNKILLASHAGNTTDEFNSIVKKWLLSAKHPTKGRLYTELVYQPMLELIEYLQENNFTVFIVSGGGIEFMRTWVEEVYGIPRNQVIGSALKTKYEYNNGNPIITMLPQLDVINDKEGKPEGINRVIGRKPVFASGNSDGDLQMLRWAASNTLKSFMLYVHHTDSVREWAYDRHSHVGRLDKGLDEARQKGWTVIDMKKDWKLIYPFELKNR